MIDQHVDEWSTGDYARGGELPAMVLIDAVARMVPGVLGHHSANEDSFATTLDCLHYTRPEIIMVSRFRMFF